MLEIAAEVTIDSLDITSGANGAGIVVGGRGSVLTLRNARIDDKKNMLGSL